MTVFVLGGSNSSLDGGWVAALRPFCPDERIVNRSNGASSTLMALFELLRHDDAQPGDAIVWEHALDEADHIRRGHAPDMLLGLVEHLLCLCHAKGLRFVGAVFTPQSEENAPRRHGYYDELARLFDHFGTGFFDVSAEWRRQMGIAKVPEAAFQDDSHYALRPDILDFIAGNVGALIARATIPQAAAPLRTGGGALRLHLPAAGGPAFSNSILSLDLEPAETSIALSGRGRLLALYCLCYPDGNNGFRAELSGGGGLHGRWARFSNSAQPAYPRPLLKALSLAHATGDGWAFTEGDRLVLRPALGGGRFLAAAGMRDHLPGIDQPQRPALAGILIETPATEPA